MLNVNTDSGILVSCIVRQIYLSCGRFSMKEEDFYEYFQDKIRIYQIALQELKTIIDNRNSHSLFYRLKLFFTNTKYYDYEEVLLYYKLIKEFVEMIEKHSFDDLFISEVGLPAEVVYLDFIEKKFNKNQRVKLNQVEHFGQSFYFKFNKIEDIVSEMNHN